MMYHMLNVLVRKDAYLKSERFSDKQLAFFPFANMIEPLSMGYTRSHDRIFYRCWFNLIGHPNFQGSNVGDIVSQMYLYRNYVRLPVICSQRWIFDKHICGVQHTTLALAQHTDLHILIHT